MIRRTFEYNPDKVVENLTLSEDFPNCVTIEYTPSPQDINSSKIPDEEKQQYKILKHELMMINGQDDFISISPINTLASQDNYLKPKYNQIISITLEGFGFNTPETKDELIDVLEEFPSGFIKNPEYGLGLLKEYRSVISSIEQIPEIKHLIISKIHDTNVNKDFYILSFSDFEKIRKGINRISKTHQDESKIEKNIFSYNALLNQLDSNKYEEKKKPYKKDVIYKFVSAITQDSSPLSNLDAKTVTNIVSANKQGIYQKHKKEILQLQQEIELLNLDSLVEKAKGLLAKKYGESEWQSLLHENPLLLTLVFGYPIIKIDEQASVGGRRINGTGDKITDFLVKNDLTNNAALVEIKKPSTKLLQKREYRNGVYAPSAELTGSINQILDQKYKFQKEIATIKDNSGVYDIESFSVDCVLIIGTIPTGNDEKKSFELFRYNFQNVRIFTFDELVAKLNDIYSALKQNK